MEFYTVSYKDLIMVGIAILVGLIVGSEREYHNKTAGLRTLMLVSVGSCIFTMLSIKIGIANPDRLAANIVTGIGFLGAGAIFKDENKIAGLTTACTIWITAALGMCVGSEHIYLGILGSFIVLFVLIGVSYIERSIDSFNRCVIYIITTTYTPDVASTFRKRFKENGMEPHAEIQRKTGNNITVHWRVLGKKKAHKAFQQLLLNDSSIIDLQF
ncbi:MgtC/SapB family protein [Ferruginibacter albus]|uniref:MgtC/SapB family protein n=1 Tax=Ferruginibacter albus TaxID=2875540 RepID=UPI001CC3A1FC|nr:MgtC/SapB family protein [Ferruginibacter albus]